MYPLKPFELVFDSAEKFEIFWVRLALPAVQQQLEDTLLKLNQVALKASKEIITEDKLSVAFRTRSCYISLKGDLSLKTGMVLEYDNPLASVHPTWVGYVTLNENGHFDHIYEAKDLDRTRSRIIEQQPMTQGQLDAMQERMLGGKLN